MPRSLAEQLDYSTVECVPNRLRISLFNVPTDSFVQVQFLIAWSDTYSDESPSTAFAVDQAPKVWCASIVGRTRLPWRCSRQA